MHKENWTTLYAKGSGKDKILVWSIWNEGNYLHMESGTLGGALIESHEVIQDGLASRTLEQQIISRIDSRINKKKDAGYLTSLEAAKAGERRNALGYKRPAKCKAYNGTSSLYRVPRFTAMQNKLNGHHANVVNDAGKLVMYSTNGKLIDTIPEILDGLEIPEGVTIEGELYVHNTPLQTISSWIKRRQPDSHRIKYHIYDVDMDCDYEHRLAFLKNLEINDRCVIEDTVFVGGEIDLSPFLKCALKDKYEGLVLRLPGYGHMDGRRSAGMIKVKPRHFKHFRIDDEFLVVDIKPSKDGWAILHCITEQGQAFTVSCHGTVPYKTKVLEEKEKHIGRHVRCEFESYTKAKKPFHVVALDWREKFEE